MSAPDARRAMKVVVADDDSFIAALVAEGLRGQGFAVATAANTTDAWALVRDNEPHALVTDLSFGPTESAAELLSRVHAAMPWIGLVVLTSHQTPLLAVPDADLLPDGVVYLVKNQMTRMHDLGDAVLKAISGKPLPPSPTSHADIILTAAQADVLRMLAEGASTRTIAERRGTNVRAAETMINRIYSALGVDGDEAYNPRIAAVRLWQQGRVTTR